MQTQSLLELTEQMIEAVLEAEKGIRMEKSQAVHMIFLRRLNPMLKKETGFARFGQKQRLRLFRKTVRNTFIMHKFRPLQKISGS